MPFERAPGAAGDDAGCGDAEPRSGATVRPRNEPNTSDGIGAVVVVVVVVVYVL